MRSPEGRAGTQEGKGLRKGEKWPLQVEAPGDRGWNSRSPFLKAGSREGREELDMRKFTYKALQL